LSQAIKYSTTTRHTRLRVRCYVRYDSYEYATIRNI